MHGPSNGGGHASIAGNHQSEKDSADDGQSPPQIVLDRLFGHELRSLGRVERYC